MTSSQIFLRSADLTQINQVNSLMQTSVLSMIRVGLMPDRNAGLGIFRMIA
jgi:hypothetical protein